MTTPPDDTIPAPPTEAPAPEPEPVQDAGLTGGLGGKIASADAEIVPPPATPTPPPPPPTTAPAPEPAPVIVAPTSAPPVEVTFGSVLGGLRDVADTARRANTAAKATVAQAKADVVAALALMDQARRAVSDAEVDAERACAEEIAANAALIAELERRNAELGA